MTELEDLMEQRRLIDARIKAIVTEKHEHGYAKLETGVKKNDRTWYLRINTIALYREDPKWWVVARTKTKAQAVMFMQQLIDDLAAILQELRYGKEDVDRQ